LPLAIGATPPLTAPPWTLTPGFTQVFRRWLCQCDGWWKQSADHRWELSGVYDRASEPLAHDQWYFFLAAALGTIVNVGKPLVRYRQHGHNVFGWPTIKQRMAKRIRGRVSAARWSPSSRAHAARLRAHVLYLAAARLQPPFDKRARHAAVAYRQFAELCEMRAAIHGGTSLRKRAAAALKLGLARGYAGNGWAFGLDALALDALAGVLGVTRRRAAIPNSEDRLVRSDSQ
jgi:hypothetical protein